LQPFDFPALLSLSYGFHSYFYKYPPYIFLFARLALLLNTPLFKRNFSLAFNLLLPLAEFKEKREKGVVGRPGGPAGRVKTQ